MSFRLRRVLARARQAVNATASAGIPAAASTATGRLKSASSENIHDLPCAMATKNMVRLRIIPQIRGARMVATRDRERKR